jgi:hypothetical protein
LHKLLGQIYTLKPVPAAQVVSSSDALEAAYAGVSQEGQTEAPEPDSAVAHHYLAFVRLADGRVWELDGDSNGPEVLTVAEAAAAAEAGDGEQKPAGADEIQDLLEPAVIKAVRERVELYAGNDPRIGLMALVQDS